MMTERFARNVRRSGQFCSFLAILVTLGGAGEWMFSPRVASAQIQIQAQIQFGRRAVPRGGEVADSEGNDGLFLPQDRDATRQLERAKQLLEDARYSDAATLLDDILKRGEDYFYQPDGAERVHRSLKMEAQRLIGEMPPEGLKTYELQFGVRAQQMLQEAAKTGDVAKLEAIARRFFHTQAGYQATLLLGRRYLDHGQPLAAALCFQRLLETKQAAAPLEPSLSIMAATSWLRGGMPDRAGEILVALRKSRPQATIALGGNRAPEFSDSQAAATWLASAADTSRSLDVVNAQQWAMHRGNPARNATGAGGIPLMNPRWRVSTTNHPSLEKSLVEVRRRNAEEGIAPLPVMQPLAVDNLVLMRTPREVLAVDFETGKRLWPIRTIDGAWDVLPTATGMPQTPFDQQPNSALTDRFWTDATQGTLSSDGKRVYLIQDARDPNEQRSKFARPAAMQFQLAPQYNMLTACELGTQGKLKWQVGGASGEDEPQLAGAYFLGPPLPLQGQLYVMAEINGEIKLWVLDASTGRVDWSQQLAVVEQTVLQDVLRMQAGCTPSFADGILVCPTAAGAAVAVDMTSRSLLWATQYQRSQQLYPYRMQVWGGNPFGAQMPAGNGALDRWNDSAAVLAEGKVLLTPLESEELHCFNLVDGKPVWKAQQRGENLYIGGVHRGHFVLVGKRTVDVIRLEDGKSALPQPVELPEGALPSGRGYLSGNDYYLPLTTAEVARIDLSSGKITHRAKSRKGSVPGNLICYRGEIVSQGVDYLEAFYQLEPLQEEIAAAMEKNPDDAWALAHRGEIALEEGRLAQAVSDLRRAHRSKPSPLTRDLLVEAFSTALSQDFDKYQDLVAELEPLVQFDQERARLLRVLAAGRQKQGQITESLDAYMKLADLPALADDELDQIDAEHSVRRDRWIRANINALVADAPQATQAAIDERLVKRLQQADEAGPAALRQFLNYFGDLPPGDRARVLLAERLSGAVTALEREQLLRQLETSSNKSLRKQAQIALAELLKTGGHETVALDYLRRLNAQYPGEELFDGKTLDEMLADLPAEAPLRRAAERTAQWPEGEVKVESNRAPRTSSYVQPFVPIEIRGTRSPFAKHLSLGWYRHMGGDLVGRDGLGAELFRISLNDNTRRAYNIAANSAYAMTYGNLLVLYTGTQVVAVDLLRSTENTSGRVLWRYDLNDLGNSNVYFEGGARIRVNAIRAGQPGRSGQGASLGHVGANGVFIHRGREIVALDPLNGKPLWTRQGMPAKCEIFGDDDVILVVPIGERDRSASVFRAIDGHLLTDHCAVPDAQQWWLTDGRCILAWSEQSDGQQQLRLVDPWAQRDVWSKTYAAGVKGTTIDDETIAVMQPDGRFQTLSLADGHVMVDQQLEAEPKLESIYVVRSPEQDILVVNRPSAENRPGSRRRRHIQAPPDGASPLVTGRIYAFNRETDALQWAAPGAVEEHGLVLSQPNDLPVLLFMRNVTDAEGPTPGSRGSVLCIDKRTGRLVYEDDALPQQIGNFEAVANLDDKTITLNMLQQTINLKFTGAATPPEPPYQAGMYGDEESPLTRAIQRAIDESTEPEDKPVKINRDPFGN